MKPSITVPLALAVAFTIVPGIARTAEENEVPDGGDRNPAVSILEVTSQSGKAYPTIRRSSLSKRFR